MHGFTRIKTNSKTRANGQDLQDRQDEIAGRGVLGAGRRASTSRPSAEFKFEGRGTTDYTDLHRLKPYFLMAA